MLKFTAWDAWAVTITITIWTTDFFLLWQPDRWSINPSSLIYDQGSKQGPSGDQSGTVAPGRQIQWSWPWGLADYSLFVTVSLVSFGGDFSPCKWENRTQPFRGSFSVGRKFPFYDFRKLFISVSLSPLCFQREWDSDQAVRKGPGLFCWVGTADEGRWGGRTAPQLFLK